MFCFVFICAVQVNLLIFLNQMSKSAENPNCCEPVQNLHIGFHAIYNALEQKTCSKSSYSKVEPHLFYKKQVEN